ncbi:tyrosine-type recombinase/integrase [Actinoallomurus sp. CA-142502]|uniref:tyrosine-type recombinase/integrase n=1 Tax=Actinoallomurus sp. CA-142502 TaxID=3239885 RepID=UPI003D90EBF9
MSKPEETPSPSKKQGARRTRGNREGKPYKTAKGWCVKAYFEDGKPKYIYGKTAKECNDKRKKFYEELEAGGPITIGKNIKLGEYLEKVWLAQTLQQRLEMGIITQSTFDSYRGSCEGHIIPDLGHIEAVKLSTSDVRKWHLDMLQKPSAKTPRKKLRPGETELPPPPRLSRRTVVIHHSALRKALADALADDVVKKNVAKLVAVPTTGKSKSKRKALTRDEAALLLAEASRDRFWVYWLTVLGLGLRRGEGLGMLWTGVDFEQNTVALEFSVQRLRGEKDEKTGRRRGRLVAKQLKTEASEATVPAPPLVMEALKAHKEAQDAERKDAEVWVNPDLVFATHLGTMLEPRNMNRAWAEVCDRSGIGRRVRIHDLRHAMGSFLFDAGIDLKVIQTVLRHTQLATTADIYTHVFQEAQRQAAAQMNGVLVDLQARRDQRDVRKTG